MTNSWDQVLVDAQARSAEIEQLRRLPNDLVELLIESEIFRTWVPRDYRGEQASLSVGWHRIEEAAYRDGAVGWCVMIGITTSLLSGSLPPEYAQEIYGDPLAITGGFAAPMGRASVSPEGLTVTGQWAWGSGSSHCTWMGGGVRLEEPLPEGAAPFVFFPKKDVTLHDTWHVAGLKGSGSGDYSVTEAFVPTGRWVMLDHRVTAIDDPLYRFSTFGALALGVSAVMLGLGRRATDELVGLGARQPQGSGRSLAERAVVQADVARAEAQLRSARSFIEQVMADAWSEAAEGEDLSEATRRLIRLATTHAAETAVSVVTTCFRAAGGAAVYDSHPLQRILRDAQVAAQHAMVAPRVFEPLGRIAFGLPTDMSSL